MQVGASVAPHDRERATKTPMLPFKRSGSLAHSSHETSWISAGSFPKSSSALVALLFLLVPIPSQVVSQIEAARPVVLGSASVTLIATLESLSVAATPIVLVSSGWKTGSPARPESLAITSSWAVPANLTTIRIDCILGSNSPAEILNGGWKKSSNVFWTQDRRSGAEQSGLVVALRRGGEGRTLYEQMAAGSSQPFTRTDYLHLDAETFPRLPQNSVPSERSLNLVVQAL